MLKSKQLHRLAKADMLTPKDTGHACLGQGCVHVTAS